MFIRFLKKMAIVSALVFAAQGYALYTIVEMMVVSAITIIIGDMEILHYSRIKLLKM